MYDFKKVAQLALSDCLLKAGRQPLKTEDVIGKTLTVVAADIGMGTNKKTGEPQEYGVVVFAEYPDNYYSGGKLLSKTIMALRDMPDFNGDMEELSAALAEQGGLQMRFYQLPNKDYVSVEIL